MIHVFATEQRILKLPGKPATTITREVELRNGKGRKTVKVMRGARVVCNKTQRLNRTEKRKIQKRKYIKGLYKPLERSVMEIMNTE
jgi:hypothetical protein